MGAVAFGPAAETMVVEAAAAAVVVAVELVAVVMISASSVWMTEEVALGLPELMMVGAALAQVEVPWSLVVWQHLLFAWPGWQSAR